MAKPQPPSAPMKLSTSLGKDKLRFRSLHAREELARLFEFDVHALAEEADIKVGDLLGKPASVSLRLTDDRERHFHGLVCAMGVVGELEDGIDYRLVLRPWLWLLTRRSDNRIFQGKSVVDIAKEVFKPFGADYEFKLSGTPPTYDYCVQYRETDFDFISRLFEREGLYYYFRHEEAKHTLVVVNAPDKHEPCPGGHEFRFRASADRALDEEPITEWARQRELQPGRWTLTDYNFETPKTSLLESANSSVPKASAKLEVYDYPGPFHDASGAERTAKLRAEMTDARHALVSGGGSTRTMTCGYRFEISDHPDRAENVAHLALATEIEMGYGGYEAGAGDDYFRCRFTAAPASVPFRPERLTPKAVVAGPHTATVVGPSGEEIHVDEHGRVKVQFHWDRLGKKDADSSCWVRVSQPSAGKGFGMVWLPRIGEEVVVDFLEGDPDRPLITGRVYNAEHMPPYTLPDHKTVSTIKSRSSKKGGAQDFNELRFEDEKGKEYLLVQAQKHRLELVKGSARSEIRKHESRTVTKNRYDKIGGELHLTVGQDAKQEVGGKLSLTVADDMLLKAGGLHSLRAGMDITAQAGTAYSVQAGTDTHVKTGTNLGMEAGMNVHLKGGLNVVIEGAIQVTLKAGPSSVVLGPDGVSITGPLVKINSGGAPGSGAGASPVAPTEPEAPHAPKPPKDPLKHS